MRLSHQRDTDRSRPVRYASPLERDRVPGEKYLPTQTPYRCRCDRHRLNAGRSRRVEPGLLSFHVTRRKTKSIERRDAVRRTMKVCSKPLISTGVWVATSRAEENCAKRAEIAQWIMRGISSHLCRYVSNLLEPQSNMKVVRSLTCGEKAVIHRHQCP